MNTHQGEGAMFADAGRRPHQHPMLIIAGMAIVLFCAVGTAAIMGWLPPSVAATETDKEKLLSPVGSPDSGVKPRAQSHAAPQKMACHSCGVVESTREISTRGEGSGIGAAGGAIIGGLLGNQVGGGNGKKLMTVAGAVGGAVAGNQIEGNMKTTSSYETVVRLDTGTTRSFMQTAQPSWRSGDQVKVVDGKLQPYS